MGLTPDQKRDLYSNEPDLSGHGPIARELRGIRLLLRAAVLKIPTPTSTHQKITEVMDQYIAEGYDEAEKP